MFVGMARNSPGTSHDCENECDAERGTIQYLEQESST